MEPLTLWLRLNGYGVLYVNPDGTIGYATWDYELNSFVVDPSGNTWESVDERDLYQSEPSLWACQAGIIDDHNQIVTLLDLDEGITFTSLRDAIQQIAPQIRELGYSVYELPYWR